MEFQPLRTGKFYIKISANFLLNFVKFFQIFSKTFPKILKIFLNIKKFLKNYHTVSCILPHQGYIRQKLGGGEGLILGFQPFQPAKFNF